jgi:hypothetical protein
MGRPRVGEALEFGRAAQVHLGVGWEGHDLGCAI